MHCRGSATAEGHRQDIFAGGLYSCPRTAHQAMLTQHRTHTLYGGGLHLHRFIAIDLTCVPEAAPLWMTARTYDDQKSGAAPVRSQPGTTGWHADSTLASSSGAEISSALAHRALRVFILSSGLGPAGLSVGHLEFEGQGLIDGNAMERRPHGIRGRPSGPSRQAPPPAAASRHQAGHTPSKSGSCTDTHYVGRKRPFLLEFD